MGIKVPSDVKFAIIQAATIMFIAGAENYVFSPGGCENGKSKRVRL